MTLNSIVKDLEHTIEYFKNPRNEMQAGRLYQAEKTLEQLRLYGVVSTCCEEMGEGFFLGTTCPKCKRPFRQVIE